MVPMSQKSFGLVLSNKSLRALHGLQTPVQYRSNHMNACLAMLGFFNPMKTIISTNSSSLIPALANMAASVWEPQIQWAWLLGERSRKRTRVTNAATIIYMIPN